MTAMQPTSTKKSTSTNIAYGMTYVQH